MKNIFTFLALLIFVITSMNFAQTYYVSAGGNDGTGDGSAGNPWLTIQHAVTAVSSGATINVAAGTYVENITITQTVTINGAGQGITTIYPAVSDPGGSGSLGHSNIMLVSANNVTISNLTLDGDNPGLTSGFIVNGADIDARNGIIEDFNAGIWNNTTVFNVTIRNIYLRGMYASSGGTGFNLHDNIVTNVAGDPSSIAIFCYGGSGIFSHNTVSQANDAISANHSRGTQFLNNIITNSGSGIHTDNTHDGGGIGPDLIQGNTVSNGPAGSYGIWVFVPYAPVTVENNIVTNVEVGIGEFAGATSSPIQNVTFNNNQIDGQDKANSIGFYLTNTSFGYGNYNVSATLSNSTIKNNVYGVYLESNLGNTLTLIANDNNQILTNTNQVYTDFVPVIYGGAGTVGTVAADMRFNWWGSDASPASSITGPSAGSVLYEPWSNVALPVELSSFTSNVNGRNVSLIWETKTEKNSDKFIIEKMNSSIGSSWVNVGSVKAAVLSNSPKQYSFTDKNLQAGKYQYRLKMIDNDGSFEYSKIVETEVVSPKIFELSQNYPNPFNPTTKIDYQIPVDAKVILEVYNIAGQKVSELVNQEQSAGYYTVDFGASKLSSGVYIYRIVANDKATGNNFSSIKKMMLLK